MSLSAGVKLYQLECIALQTFTLIKKILVVLLFYCIFYRQYSVVFADLKVSYSAGYCLCSLFKGQFCFILMFYGAGEELVILYIACVMFEIDGEGSDSARMGEKA